MHCWARKATTEAILLGALAGCAGADPACLALAEAAPGAPAGAVWDGEDHNVLLVVLDDVGIDKLAAYGVQPDQPSTPTLDALAAEGVRFDRAWAYPTCAPSRAALLTGRSAAATGIGVAKFTEDFPKLSDDEVSIADVVREATGGVAQSAIFGKWGLGTRDERESRCFPLQAGFDRALTTAGNLIETALDGRPQRYRTWQWSDDGRLRRQQGYITDATTDAAIEWIAQTPSPWFLELSFHGAHSPYHTPPGLDSLSTAKDKYDAVVTDLDTDIGRLLDAMDPDVRARTTLVVLGDNGTPATVIRAPFDGLPGKSTVAESGVRMPLFISGPGVVGGRATSELLQIEDLFPTLLSFMGITLSPEMPALEGLDLASLLSDPAAVSPRELLHVERFIPNGPGPYEEHVEAVSDGEFRLAIDIRGDEHLRRMTDTIDAGPDLLDEAPTLETLRAYGKLSEALDSFAR